MGVSFRVMPILERLSDPYGVAIVGWLAPRVLYARFGQTISADVGARFARRFAALVGDTSGVRYFGDSSEVAAYDLLALRVVVDAMLSKRGQFSQIVVRPWAGALDARAVALLDRLGCMEYLANGTEFDVRLAAAGGELRSSATLVDVGAPLHFSDPGDDAPVHPRPTSSLP